MRIGHGYDAHRLVAHRPLVLGGVTIPFERGLTGHSDADVLTHALMDALLGAAALGDIGQHFPDSEAQYEGVSSLTLLRKVEELLAENGYRVVNVDATILAEKPKIAPYRAEMIANLASALDVDASCVSVKATTEERMGFTGSGEGIACHAVCLIESL